MTTYNDDDLILSMSVMKHNISNPEYNYEIAIWGNGKVMRKGGVYEEVYPGKISKEVIDTILDLGLKIKDAYAMSTPSRMVHDAPTCRLKVFSNPTFIDFCATNNKAVHDLTEYISSTVILPL
jgi:hypothetical protein